MLNWHVTSHDGRSVEGHQGEFHLTGTGIAGQPVVVGHLVWSRAHPLVVWSGDNRGTRVLLLQLPTPLMCMRASLAASYQILQCG